jgi:pSer/pThr/pTyr-binding forkhead associated (FHA) protein
MKVTFTIKDEKATRTVEICDNATIKMGRESKSNDVVVHATTVSRTHGTFSMRINKDTGAKEWTYEDHSRHGTKVTSEKSGDKVKQLLNSCYQLGDQCVVLELGPKAIVTVKFEEPLPSPKAKDSSASPKFVFMKGFSPTHADSTCATPPLSPVSCSFFSLFALPPF